MLANAGAPGCGRRLDQRVQQQKVAAFASGMHALLGAASGVSWLDEQALVMIANEVLGGWGLLKEWRQELVAGNV